LVKTRGGHHRMSRRRTVEIGGEVREESNDLCGGRLEALMANQTGGLGLIWWRLGSSYFHQYGSLEKKDQAKDPVKGGRGGQAGKKD